MIKPVHEPFKPEQAVVYSPHKVPKYAGSREAYDAEDYTFNFKEGIPVKHTDEPVTAMHDPHRRLPDEFHNTEFEKHHPDLVQPTHYDSYDPMVEGFFGPGFSFEP